MIEVITTPHPDAIVTQQENNDIKYAYGLMVGRRDGEPVIGHNGGWVGFTSSYFRFPRLSLSTVVFCNAADAKARDLGRRLGEIAVGHVKAENDRALTAR
ncbi:MAG: hypothetical protein GTN89_12745 [Acidobacteria bacterium]|nr:hypothetical protein [Acidobacteriota bacterium]NIM63872.1 hypothetical protein [Acidobacteriota bacterium]NIO60141.1 hypothetical protein [Acidobacteriota bacterium]NIQ31205.1 hypothetical protein [Acidobacteriota bacterium]NIQ86342.1 hypothetical protein [Acidobacteriota bacterium]